jgi:hypothetical protein
METRTLPRRRPLIPLLVIKTSLQSVRGCHDKIDDQAEIEQMNRPVITVIASQLMARLRRPDRGEALVQPGEVKDRV